MIAARGRLRDQPCVLPSATIARREAKIPQSSVWPTIRKLHRLVNRSTFFETYPETGAFVQLAKTAG
jgi:hypothetical protein